MRHLRRQPLVIGLVMVLLALGGGTVFAATRLSSRAASGSATPIVTTPIVLQGTPPANGVGATKTTDEGLALMLVQIVKHGSRWLFQFQIRNTASMVLTIRGTRQEHQFVVAGDTGAAPPNNVGVAQLSSPSEVEIAANHPDLARTLQAGKITLGWLVVDTTHLGFTPTQLLYRDVAVHTVGCTNPADPSTCQPATLYTGVDWFPL